MTAPTANAGYELVQRRRDSDTLHALHVRAIARRGTQHPTLCGKLQPSDVGPVAVDPFQSLWSQVTCVACKRALDKVRP